MRPGPADPAAPQRRMPLGDGCIGFQEQHSPRDAWADALPHSFQRRQAQPPLDRKHGHLPGQIRNVADQRPGLVQRNTPRGKWLAMGRAGGRIGVGSVRSGCSRRHGNQADRRVTGRGTGGAELGLRRPAGGPFLLDARPAVNRNSVPRHSAPSPETVYQNARPVRCRLPIPGTGSRPPFGAAAAAYLPRTMDTRTTGFNERAPAHLRPPASRGTRRP